MQRFFWFIGLFCCFISPSTSEAKSRENYFNLRLYVGPAFALPSSSTSFVFALKTGGMFELARFTKKPLLLLAIRPEVGYRFRISDRTNGNFGTLGLGLSLTSAYWGFEYIPRFVLGSSQGRLTYGVRNSLGFVVLRGFFGLEFSHQLLFDSLGASHELEVGLYVDFGMMVHAFFKAVGRMKSARKK